MPGPVRSCGDDFFTGLFKPGEIHLPGTLFLYRRAPDMHYLMSRQISQTRFCSIFTMFVQRCSLNVPGTLAHLYITAGIL